MKQMRRLISWTIICLFLAPICRANAEASFQVLNPEVFQGDLLVIKLGQYYMGRNIGLHAFNKTHASDRNGFVFVGVDFYQIKPGSYEIYLIDYNTKQRIDWNSEKIMVIAKSFPVIYSKSLSKSSSPKRKREELVISSAFMTNRETNYMNGKFYKPLQRINISGDHFGTHRVYRDGSVHLHRGVDLRAKTGTPVMAMNSGKVVLANRFSLEGNMIVIDHGLGIFSLYMHLSKFKVKNGQMVNPNQEIGLSGSTGRGTGPHLHSAMKINGASVDPLRFVDTINKYFL